MALHPGYGIGPDVVDATVPVLDAVAHERGSFQLAYQSFDWGMPHYEQPGRASPRTFSPPCGVSMRSSPRDKLGTLR